MVPFSVASQTGQEGWCCPDLCAECGADRAGQESGTEGGLLELSFDKGRSFQAQKAAGTEAWQYDTPGLQGNREARGDGEEHLWRGRQRHDFTPGSLGDAED